MLRIILIIIISYIVIRIALRLLLSESPAQRRARMYQDQNTVHGSDTFGNTRGYGPRKQAGSERNSAQGRFDHIEDAEFEEIPPDKTKKDEK